jgi:hypothetical protein
MKLTDKICQSMLLLPRGETLFSIPSLYSARPPPLTSDTLLRADYRRVRDWRSEALVMLTSTMLNPDFERL